MSGATSANKSTVDDKSKTANSAEKDTTQQDKPTAPLEEDDEFEDFPVEGTTARDGICGVDGRLAD